MAKIYITGSDEPEVVSDEVGREILAKKNDAKYKGTVQVNNRSIPKSRIREVAIGDQRKGRQVKYNPSNPEDMIKLKEVEKLIREIADGPQPHPLEWYGEPHEIFVKRHPQHAARQGFIFHAMFGLVHWSAVEFALQQRAITRTGDSWSVYGAIREGNHTPDISAYLAVSAAIQAIRELEARRRYAERVSRGEPPEEIHWRQEIPVDTFEPPTEESALAALFGPDESETNEEIPF